MLDVALAIPLAKIFTNLFIVAYFLSVVPSLFSAQDVGSFLVTELPVAHNSVFCSL